MTLNQTTLTYTGGTVGQNGQPLTVSGVLTNDSNTPVSGQPVTFTLGSGTTAQTCAAVTTATGAASCVINVTGQPQGPIPVTDTFGGTTYYQTSTATSTVNLPEGTTLTVTPGSGTYNGPTTVSGTLVNSYTNAPVPNETGDPDGQRDPEVHGDDERQRRGLLHRDAERARRHVHALGIVRR